MSPGGFKRSFLNDCLLAASCREVGATLISLNREDFELIRKVLRFEFTEPWPDLAFDTVRCTADNLESVFDGKG